MGKQGSDEDRFVCNLSRHQVDREGVTGHLVTTQVGCDLGPCPSSYAHGGEEARVILPIVITWLEGVEVKVLDSLTLPCSFGDRSGFPGFLFVCLFFAYTAISWT